MPRATHNGSSLDEGPTSDLQALGHGRRLRRESRKRGRLPRPRLSSPPTTRAISSTTGRSHTAGGNAAPHTGYRRGGLASRRGRPAAATAAAATIVVVVVVAAAGLGGPGQALASRSAGAGAGAVAAAAAAHVAHHADGGGGAPGADVDGVRDALHTQLRGGAAGADGRRGRRRRGGDAGASAAAPPPPLPLDFGANPDVLALQSTLSILQLQRQRAAADMVRLRRAKDAALADPAAFVADLRAGALSKDPDPLFGGGGGGGASGSEEEEEDDDDDEGRGRG